jgi:hypothetical protein
LTKRARKSSRPVLGRSSRPRERLVSGPDINLKYSKAGRETLAAIAEELSQVSEPSDRVRALARAASSPEIAVRETVAGRETLGAIAAELREDPRTAINTKPYGDRISNAPGAKAPPRPTLGTAPEIDIRQTSIGRDTMAAINSELAIEEAVDEDDAPTSSVLAAQSIELYEMMTFVAKGDVAKLSSANARRDFVRDRLLHRLPVMTLDDVDRVDVTPWTERGTVLVRVWCRVVPPQL